MFSQLVSFHQADQKNRHDIDRWISISLTLLNGTLYIVDSFSILALRKDTFSVRVFHELTAVTAKFEKRLKVVGGLEAIIDFMLRQSVLKHAYDCFWMQILVS